MSADVLASIDGALRDYGLSKDAMRWVPDGEREAVTPEPAPARVAVILDTEPFARAMEDMGRMLLRLFGDLGTAAGEMSGKLTVAARADAERQERRRGGGKLAVDGHEYQRRLRARRRRR